MIMFRHQVTDGDFTPETGMSVVYCGRKCPQSDYVPGDDAYELSDLSDLKPGEFYGVFDPAQPEPTWWVCEVVDV